MYHNRKQHWATWHPCGKPEMPITTGGGGEVEGVTPGSTNAGVPGKEEGMSPDFP